MSGFFVRTVVLGIFGKVALRTRALASQQKSYAFDATGSLSTVSTDSWACSFDLQLFPVAPGLSDIRLEALRQQNDVS